MFKLIRNAALSALIGLGAIAALPASAQANSFQLGIGSGGTSMSFHFGDSRDRYHRAPRQNYRQYGQCSQREAVRKASRMGVRHARVVHANHRTVHVEGRARGYHNARIVFANARNCPVIR